MSKDMWFLCILLGIIAFVVLLGMREKERRRKAFLDDIRKKYGHVSGKTLKPSYMLRLREAFEAGKKAGVFYVDDITWKDLHMDDLYVAMDNCISDAGKHCLYARLRTPFFTEEEKNKWQKRIAFFAENSAIREEFLMLLFGCCGSRKLSLHEYMAYTKANYDPKQKDGSINALICIALFFISLFLIFAATGIGICFMLLTLSHNIVTYYKYRARYLPYLSALRYVFSLVNAGDACAEKILSKDAFCGGLEALSEPLGKMKGFRRQFAFLFSGYDKEGSMAGVFWTYCNMVLHFDILGFDRLFHSVFQYEAEIRKIYEVLGEAECAIAVASYRDALGAWCEPEMTGEFVMDNLYHPLIMNPVKNSFVLERCVLLTGCNASGKSTFLRTVAVNMLMAQTIATATADRFVSGYCRIYSSMSLKDNLLEGESYYMAELKAMKRILDAAQGDGPLVVCFVDEVLRGTNTVERIAASAGILKYLQKTGTLCMAATHDGELTEILRDTYDNYHFDEEMQGDDVVFEYKIKTGAATSRNAILLLDKMGYSDTIVKEAGELAERIGYHVKS